MKKAIGLIVVAAALFAPSSASAAFGDLTFANCLDHVVGGDDCEPGEANMGPPGDLVISPDGANAYSITGGGEQMNAFDRDPVTGALTFTSCWEGPGMTDDCINDISAFVDPSAIAISPDGRSIYVVAATSDSLIEFARDPVTGTVDFDINGSCTDDDDTQPGGGCPDALGLDQPLRVAVSPDNQSIYVASSSDDTLVQFDRKTNVDPTTDPSFGLPENDTCYDTPPAPEVGCTDVSDGGQVLIELPSGIAVSPDGKSLYLTDSTRDSVITLDRITLPSANVGDLNSPRCIQDVGEVQCDDGVPATVDHTEGLQSASGVEIASTGASGDSVYVTSVADGAIVRFIRDNVTGTLSPVFCFSDNDDEVQAGCTEIDGLGNDAPGQLDAGPNGPHNLAISPDGRSVYVAANQDNAIARFARTTTTGGIVPAGCFGESDLAEIEEPSCVPVGDQMEPTNGVAFAGDGFLYSTAVFHINTFNRELDPPAPPPGPGPTTPLTPVTTTPAAAGPTGQRAAALKKCKKKKRKARKKCKKRALKLPV